MSENNDYLGGSGQLPTDNPPVPVKDVNDENKLVTKKEVE